MGRNSVENQVIHTLCAQTAYGESKHLAKAALRKAGNYKFGMMMPKIYSKVTFKTYKQVSLQYVRWCQVNKGLSKYAHINKYEPYAIEYLQYRKDSGKSKDTLDLDRAGLGHLFKKQINFDTGKRNLDKITRSRGSKKMDKHFSEKNNANLINITKATGGRRDDMRKLHTYNFREINGRLYVDFIKSKGGRSRVSPVLPEMEKAVLDYKAKVISEGRTNLFERIHTKADVHSFRREYAQDLYKMVSKDRTLLDELLVAYPPRSANKYEKNIQSNTYTARRGKNRKTYCRDALYLVSQALGHNRLEVVVNHYF